MRPDAALAAQFAFRHHVERCAYCQPHRLCPRGVELDRDADTAWFRRSAAQARGGAST